MVQVRRSLRRNARPGERVGRNLRRNARPGEQVGGSLRRNAHSRPLPLPVSPRLYVVESRTLNDRADSGESRARRVDILPCDRTD